jgi:hypothetical protein
MSLRRELRRLERLAQGEIISIPQQDGPPARFPESALREAFLNAMERLKGGPDVPPRHPLLEAARNSSDSQWRESFFSDIDYEGATTPIEDLSE